MPVEKLADPAWLIIRGGSRGGFTVLAVHAFHARFSVSASHFGISDLTILANHTFSKVGRRSHGPDFQSRGVGPRAIYDEVSFRVTEGNC